jgi:hypothetical protein
MIFPPCGNYDVPDLINWCSFSCPFLLAPRTANRRRTERQSAQCAAVLAGRRARLSPEAKFSLQTPAREDPFAASAGRPRAAAKFLSYFGKSGGWDELGIIGERVSKRGVGGLWEEKVPAVPESEFPEKIRDVVLCRALCDIQLARNLLVCEVPKKKLEHLAFSCR